MLIDSLIRFSVRNKFVVMLLTLALIGWGIWALGRIPIDAVPDITNNQVQVITMSPTLAPQEVEQYITTPVELQLANLPGVEDIRSISNFGLSVITVVFDEAMPVLDARQLVNEQLPLAAEAIPPDFGTPRMMPISTGLGEIFQYVLEVEPGYEDQYDAMKLRTIQDWIVKRYLNGIEGVVEINSFGGFVRQFEVALLPDRLRALDITVPEVEQALLNDNQNAGSAYLEEGGRSFYVRAQGLIRTKEDLAQVLVANRQGLPVLVRDIAKVREGFPPRYGAMTRNGQGEAVGGITMMLKGANSDQVIRAVKERIANIQSVLPPGIHLHAYLDRSELVSRTTSTVEKNLLEGGLIVVFVLVLLLGNLRAGLIVASVIPLALLFAFGLMELFGVSANLMSLGAIDFGLIVDGAVILVEATVHRLESRFSGKRLLRNEMDDAVIEATSRIRKSASFGEIIILMVYLPLLGLEGVEGKMFVPMAQTVSFAILGALVLSLTYVPMMASLVLSRSPRQHRTLSDRLVEGLHRLYEPALKLALRRRWWVLSLAGISLMATLWLFGRMGGEFIPQLDEGDLAMQMSLPPGSSLSQSVKTSTAAERLLLANFPGEVKEVVSKIGTAEVPTDPMGVEDADIMIILQPKEQWTHAEDRYELVSLMQEVLEPLEEDGTSFEFTQPIELRFNELLTGSKSDVVIKIFGDDLDELARLGQAVVPIVEKVPGAADVILSRTSGFPQLMIEYRRDRLAALGISVGDVNRTVQAAIAGLTTGVVFETDRRFDLVLRLHPDYRMSPSDLERLQVRSANGQAIPLREIADIRYAEGPMRINHDNTRRQVSIGVNVRGRDVEQLVAELQQTLQRDLPLPAGYGYFFGGEFEQLQSASRRLMITVPLVLALIYALLYLTFGSFAQALMIFSAIPLAAIGGVLSLWLRGMPFSISAGVGFIALFGVAVLNGIVLIGYLNQLEHEGVEDLRERILEAARVRFRPVVMTALVASLGFLPMAISSGAGAEVQRPLATVVIGGLLTATILTLIVLPVLYSFQARRRSRLRPQGAMLVLLLLGIVPASFAQTPVLTEEAALELAQTQSAQVRLGQANREVVAAGGKGFWNPGETAIQWQQGQMNTSAFDALITVAQPLGRPWEVPTKRSGWEEAMASSDAGLREASRDAQLEVASLYEEWYRCEAMKGLSDSLLQLYDELLRIQQLRAEAGEELPFERGLAITAQGQWQLRKSDCLRRQVQVQAALQRMLGLEAMPLLPTGPGPARALPDSLQAIMAAFSQTSTYERLFHAQAQQSQALRLQKLQQSPALELGWFGQTIDGENGFQGAYLGVSVPLWVPAQTAKVQVQQAQLAAQQVQMELEEEAFRQKAQTFWADYLYQREALQLYQGQGQVQAEMIQRVVLDRYRLGEVPFAEVLRLLSQTASWQEARLEARYRLHLSILTLRFLTQ